MPCGLAPGKVGEGKIGGLLDTGARVHVVALQAGAAVHEWARNGKITLELRAFTPEDLDAAFLANRRHCVARPQRIYFIAKPRGGAFCATWSMFRILRLLLSRGGASGRSSDCDLHQGQSPSLAQRIRQQLERQFGLGYAAWVAELGATRRLVLASDLDPQRKRELLHSLASREALNAALAEESAGRFANEVAENDRRVIA